MVELLITVLLSSVVLLAVYFVFITNTRQFYMQEQIVQSQETTRFALEFIMNDLRNAGSLAVVNGDPDNSVDVGFCRPSDDLQSVFIFEDPLEAPAILRSNGNNLAPDRVRLLLDGSGATPLITEEVIGNFVRIAVDQPTQDGRDIVGTQARFESVFRPGLLLRIYQPSDRQLFDLVAIESTQYNDGGPYQITTGATPFRNGVITECEKFEPSNCDGLCLVNPVKHVEYAVIEDPFDSTKTDLVRRVADWRTDPLGTLETLVVAEFVVNLQLWGTYDVSGAGQPANLPPDTDPTDDLGNWVNDWPPGNQEGVFALNIRPEQLRSLHVLLATRTPREDPSFTVQMANMNPMDHNWFNVDARGAPILARVTTISTQVETPNLVRAF